MQSTNDGWSTGKTGNALAAVSCMHRHQGAGHTCMDCRIMGDSKGQRTKLRNILCYMDRREGDAAENLNIRSSRGASEYSLIFQTDLPCARVQFIFSNCPAGRPSTVWFFKLSCRAAESNWQAGRGRSIRRPDEVAVGNRVRSPDRSAEAGLSIGQGRPAGQFEKPNCKRPPGRTVWKNELY